MISKINSLDPNLVYLNFEMFNKSSLSTFRERKDQEEKDLNEVKDFFIKSWYEVEDVHNNTQYFDKDIDLLIKKDWEINTIEIKFDDYLDSTTQNFFFEIISNEQRTTKWCFLMSNADILLYYATSSKTWYFFPLPKLRNWFFEVRNDFRNPKDIDKYFKLKSTHTKDENWKYHHTTIWRLIDKKVLLYWCEKKGIKYSIKNIIHENF